LPDSAGAALKVFGDVRLDVSLAVSLHPLTTTSPHRISR
jgi:hypothetical protein